MSEVHRPLDAMPKGEAARLVYAGLVFCTEYGHGGKVWCGQIIARTWEDAEQAAIDRGLGETVTGRLEAALDGPDWLR